MSTVQQRSVKATFFEVVRAGAGIRSFFMANALLFLVWARRFADMANSLLGNFRPKLETKTRNENLEIRN